MNSHDEYGQAQLECFADDPECQVETAVCCRVFLCANASFFFFLFSLGSAGSWLLRGLFSSGGEQGLSFAAVQRLLVAVASLVVEHRL